jgi:leucyl aminopeptidase (aminopeptidase T)
MKPNSSAGEKTIAGIKALLFNCAGITPADRVYIISNPATEEIGSLLKYYAEEAGTTAEHDNIEQFAIHGQEPGQEIADKMFHATVIFCVTKMSMAHTKARLRANENKVKYFSLPDYSMDVVESPALLADFKKLRTVSEKIASLLTQGNRVELTTRKGTNLSLSVKGRVSNPAPGFCYDHILLASPPDAETNIAPLEFETNGVVIVDGSIPCNELGLLTSDITLTIKGGYVEQISGEKSEVLTQIFNRLNNPKTRIVAEFGIGLNPLAKLKGSMLEDEGTLGTVHLGIGSNKTIGGLNEVPFHLDHIIRDATVSIDGTVFMENGALIKELNDLL